MSDNETPKLRVSRVEASERISKQIDISKDLFERQPASEQEFDKLKQETRKWTDYNKTLFGTLFDESPLSFLHGSVMVVVGGQSWIEEANTHKDRISRWINDLESICERLELYEELPSSTQQTVNRDTMNNENKKIFIGHGGSDIWKVLRDFIVDTLELEYEEFDRVSPAGEFIGNRLEEMLDKSCMAFLIMTGEDEQADGSLHARENVIHEIGFFQGRLGFKRAIILLEEGCQEFSNIRGIGQIRFPKGDMRAAFEDIFKVLKRESIV